MAISSSLARSSSSRKNILAQFTRLSILWKVTWFCLIPMLFLPMAALILKAARFSRELISNISGLVQNSDDFDAIA
jgi:hypothetical protein